MKEAVDAAEDGDRILLLSGIHNGMGYVVSSHARDDMLQASKASASLQSCISAAS